MDWEGRSTEPPHPIDLAAAANFGLGVARVVPSRLMIAGPAGEISTEPRVMQVLIVLHEAAGTTVSREALMAQCWPGVIVGDDAVNRAIGELRRALRAAGVDAEVETVPRVGYRLETGPGAAGVSSRAETPDRLGVSRRLALAGAALAVLTVGGGYTWLRRATRDPRVDALVESAHQALREELPDRNAQGLGFLREAAARAPNDPEVLGLLAVAWRNATEYAPAASVASAAAACERAARAALAIDPAQGDALSALATLQPFYGDWIGSEKRLLSVLAVAPDALPAISHLTTLYQSAGLVSLSRDMNEHALRLDPLSPVFRFRAALKDWIFGDIAAADAGIDRTLELWPRHPAVWNTRLMLYAFTGRITAAQTFLSSRDARPPGVPQPVIERWDLSLRAIGGDAAAARDAKASHRAAVIASVPGAVMALMFLSYIGDIDAAYEVAEGFLLRRGPLAASVPTHGRQTWVTDLGWRRSMMLFTPTLLPVRRDPRFAPLVGEMGLTKYWRARGTSPDYLALDRRTTP